MYLFTIKQDLKIHTGEKILKKDTISAVIGAEEMLDAARAEAEQIIVRAHEKAKGIHKKAKKAGYAKGLEIYNEHILYFDDRIKNLRHELQNTILPLVLKTTKRIVGEGLKEHPELIVDIITQVIKNVTTSNEVKLFVHKGDIEIVEAHKDDFKKLFERLDMFLIEERSDVEKGSCIIQTEKGILNASLSNQYAALKKALEKTKNI
jgi:flagellar biosynthesis/type III secretory pathway protein FliH